MAQQYQVTGQYKLLEFLFLHLENWSKKTVKQRLQGGGILVNDMVQTKHDFMLNPNDVVSIGSVQYRGEHRSKGPLKLEILYQDKDLIAINKPAGLLSVGTDREKSQHALALLRMQLSRGKQRVKLWPVHRLDRDTSGILLFATSKEVREAIMSKWNETEKIYLAVVEGRPAIEKDSIIQALYRDEQTYHMHVGEHPHAKPAITHYRLKKSTATRSLLEVQLETGRQHQIRAHMAWLGTPVVGDERYGTKGDRMGLHAYKLSFIHPLGQRKIRLEVDAAQDFYQLLT